MAKIKIKEITLQPPRAKMPVSRPRGRPTFVRFVNASGKTVRIVWISLTGKRKRYAELKPKKSYVQGIRKGAVWLVTDTKDRPLGYFVATGTSTRVMIRARRDRDE